MTAKKPPFNVFFEDQHLIVLSKPPGLLSQGGQIAGRDKEARSNNLVDILREYFGRNYVGLIHRLDRNTSGLMVVAKRSKAAQRLTEALQKNLFQRCYLAILMGKLTEKQIWKDQLVKDSTTNRVRVTSKGGKLAELTVRPLETIENPSALTLAAFILKTGRSHQIRAQSQYRKLSLLGDLKYEQPNDLDFKKINWNSNRVALHSACVTFPHPMTQEKMVFTDDFPKEFKTLGFEPTSRHVLKELLLGEL